MDDSSFCQQKPYSCTAEYYIFYFTVLYGWRSYLVAYSKYMHILVHGSMGTLAL